MRRGLKHLFPALLVLLTGSGPIAVQTDNGSIGGVVTNQHGPLANATVEARNAINGARGYAQTDLSGRYLIAELRQGRYSMWVRATEHESVWVAQVIVMGGQTATRDVYLRQYKPAISLTRLP